MKKRISWGTRTKRGLKMGANEISFTRDQDTNGNGIIDDDELTEEQLALKKSHRIGYKDMSHLFALMYSFTICMMGVMFVTWFVFGVTLSPDLNKLALALNLFITILGIVEGTRSIMVSATEEEEAPVPAYKLRYLLGYLIWYILITVIAVALEFIVSICVKEGETVPDFATDNFITGIVSNMVSYLIARFGSKLGKCIDLSNFRLFAKK